MNCLSLNVRGLGEDHKVSWVRRLKIRHRCNFLGIQETQLVDTEMINVEGCWDGTEFRHTTIQSTGRSGGLISIWDPSIFEVEEVIKSRYYLITMGNWNGIQGSTIIANIYGPHQATEKKQVWEEL